MATRGDNSTVYFRVVSVQSDSEQTVDIIDVVQQLVREHPEMQLAGEIHKHEKGGFFFSLVLPQQETAVAIEFMKKHDWHSCL